jgi:hypothetical protein
LDLAIWIIVIVVCVLGLVFALLTSVTKWGDKVVDKYVKEDDDTKNTNKNEDMDNSGRG